MIRLLCWLLPFKEMGWKEINEVFFRWTLLKTHWFSIYIHRLDAQLWHPQCHDHPWWFVAIIISGGYWEEFKGKTLWRAPGSILYRPAVSQHNVRTNKVNWSIVIVGRKERDWGFLKCGS